MNEFVKTHGLGNEYIVLDSEKIDFELTDNIIQTLCNIHYGIGSDGILLKVPTKEADFGLRIYNPDGSEAEKSGNGLRIFSKFLFDYGYSYSKSFSIHTPGGIVHSHIVEEKNDKAFLVKVEMGKAIFKSRYIPINADSDLFFDQSILAGDKQFTVNCVSVGNPHCVILKNNLDVEEIKKYGPLLETHGLFPKRINVQFMKLISNTEVEILIWERGAGFTLASGSSSSAVAAVARKKGLVGNYIKVRMPGGVLDLEIDEDFNIQMTGEVREICSGILSKETIMQ